MATNQAKAKSFQYIHNYRERERGREGEIMNFILRVTALPQNDGVFLVSFSNGKGSVREEKLSIVLFSNLHFLRSQGHNT